MLLLSFDGIHVPIKVNLREMINVTGLRNWSIAS